MFLVSAAAAHGGYFAGSWGWLTLFAAWAAVLALVLDAEAGLSRAGLAFAGLLAAYALWSLLSALWSVDATSTVLEAQRNLVYVAAALGALLLARSSALAVVVAAWLAIAAISGYALLTRLVPDRLGRVDPISDYRLDAPVGYWNSLSLFAAVGILVAAGLAARSSSLSLRVASAASVPALAATMYYTFSRGGWASLVVGVVALVAVDPRRLQTLYWLVPLGASGAAAVWLAARDGSLSTNGASLAQQTHDGHRTLLALAVLTAITAAVAAAWASAEHQLTFESRAANTTLAALVVVAAIGFVVVEGSPWSVAQRSWHSFASAPPATEGNLGGRVFHLSNNGRLAQWKVAWREAKAHPAVGSGAGTWERYWNQDRPKSGHVVNVHNLYLEALATLGVVGLALLAAALATPLATGFRRRRTPLAPFVLGAFAAYLAHAIVDWDWQITGVTLPVVALVCAVLLGGEPDLRLRPVLYGAGVVLAAVGLWGIASQTTLSKVKTWSSARHAADAQPWSTEPWKRLGEYDVDHARFAEARRALARALAKDRGDWELWFDLARASDGRTRANALDRAQKLNPHEPAPASFRRLLGSISTLQGYKP
ncbi:MAG TPA: O-antigen ligase family protein [Gaiellaceae bacterium]|nr:O-antigen ligase family protein [Gaiellaceae bacterium]